MDNEGINKDLGITPKVTGQNQKMILAALSSHDRLSLLQVIQATAFDRRSATSSLRHAEGRGLVQRMMHLGSVVFCLTQSGRAVAAKVELPVVNAVTKPSHVRGGTNSAKVLDSSTRPARSIFDL